MKSKTKKNLRLFYTTVIYWIIASLLFHVLRRIGIGGEMGLEIVAPVTKLEGFRIAIFLGLVMGVFYGVLELVFENPWMKRKSLGAILLIKTVAYTILVGLLTTIAAFYVNEVIESSIIVSRAMIIETGAIYSVILFFLLSSSFIHF